MNSGAVSRFDEAGFAVVPGILDKDEVCEISRQLELLGTANAGTQMQSSQRAVVGGRRTTCVVGRSGAVVRRSTGCLARSISQRQSVPLS